VDSREKTDQDDIDNKGKDPRDRHGFIGLVNLSRKLMVAGEKEKSVDDSFAFEPPRMVCRIMQGYAPDTSKNQSRSAVGDCRILVNVEKGKPKKTISTSTQTQRSCGQVGSTEVQTEVSDKSEIGWLVG
jgi:hypothetical protein